MDDCTDPVIVQTGSWGDVAAPWGGPNEPSFGDISALVDRFIGALPVEPLTRSDIAGSPTPDGGNIPDQIVNFVDISADVGAFQGLDYPFAVPPCP